MNIYIYIYFQLYTNTYAYIITSIYRCTHTHTRSKRGSGFSFVLSFWVHPLRPPGLLSRSACAISKAKTAQSTSHLQNKKLANLATAVPAGTY